MGRKDLLNMYSDLDEVIDDVKVSKNKHDFSFKKIKINFSFIIIIILVVIIGYCLFNIHSLKSSNVILNDQLKYYSSVSQNNSKFDKLNEETIIDYENKLLNEIGYSEDELNTLREDNKKLDDLEFINILSETYNSEYEKLSSEIEKQTAVLQSYELTVDTSEMDMRTALNTINEVITNEEERLSQIEKQNSEIQPDSNSDVETNSSSDLTNGEVESDEKQNSEMCFSSYDEAYDTALNKMLESSNIEKFSIDINNCPIYLDKDGNVIS